MESSPSRFLITCSTFFPHAPLDSPLSSPRSHPSTLGSGAVAHTPGNPVEPSPLPGRVCASLVRIRPICHLLLRPVQTPTRIAAPDALMCSSFFEPSSSSKNLLAALAILKPRQEPSSTNFSAPSHAKIRRYETLGVGIDPILHCDVLCNMHRVPFV